MEENGMGNGTSNSGVGAAAHADWDERRARIREDLATRDINGFLRWGTIMATMTDWTCRTASEDLRFLIRQEDWPRWEEAIKETPIGTPSLCPKYPASSGALIGGATHLARFENETGLAIDQLDYVFEFGGGYGSTCRLCHNLGFKGKYVHYDFPELIQIQQFFLGSLGITATYISDPSELMDAVTDFTLNSLFLATWSYSESDSGARYLFEPAIFQCGAFLVAYAHDWRQYDNQAYFDGWVEGHDEIEWQRPLITHLPWKKTNYGYLIGKHYDL